MKLSEIEPVFCELLATQSIFMAFGIPAEDVYVNYTPPRLQALAVQGDLKYVVDVAEIALTAEEYAAECRAVFEAWNDAPVEARMALTDRTKARMDMTQIMAGMLLKGFKTKKD